MIKRVAIAVGSLAFFVALLGISSESGPRLAQVTPTPTPGFIPWYYALPSPWPSPVFSANAAVGGAFGSAYIYNSGTNPLTTASPGSYFINNTTACYFLCYGAPGQAAHHVFVYGNDFSATSFTSQGAPDDCAEPGTHYCPAGVPNQVFSISVNSPGVLNFGFFVGVDGKANLGVFGELRAGSAVVAGVGTGTPEPSPIPPGALVSYGGVGKGYLVLGSASDYLTCDYGSSAGTVLTCDKPLVIASPSGGIRPNGVNGGYAAEVFPGGAAETHPKIVSGSCTVAGATLCTFGNSFAFGDTNYNCTVTAQGASGATASYAKTANNQITIYYTSVTGVVFSYICID